MQRLYVHFNIIVKSQTLVFKCKLAWSPPHLKLTAARFLRLQWGGGEPSHPGQPKIIDTRQHLPDGILMICTYKLQKHNEQDRQTGA